MIPAQRLLVLQTIFALSGNDTAMTALTGQTTAGIIAALVTAIGSDADALLTPILATLVVTLNGELTALNASTAALQSQLTTAQAVAPPPPPI
jgi:hypothetical protein